MRIPASLLSILLSFTALRAEELHVHPLAGSDLVGTGAPSSPFRSLGKALAQARAGDVVVAAIGTYDPRNGERFPLQLDPGVSLKGPGMRDAWILAASPWEPALKIRVAGGGMHPVRLEGFTVLGGSTGIEVVLEGQGDAPALELVDLAVEESGQGLLVRDAAPFAGLTAALSLERNLLAGHWGSGLVLAPIAARIACEAVNCALLDNGADGLLAWPAGLSSRLDLELVHCTVARNAGAGLRIQGTASGGGAGSRVANSILWGNRSGDLAGVDPGSVSHSLLGGGPALGRQGNITGDPRFLSAREWRIGHGSAALGLGRADLPGLPLLDLEGQERGPGKAPDAGADEQVLHTLIPDPRGARVFRSMRLTVFTRPRASVAWLVSTETFFPGFAFPGLTGRIQLNFILALELLGAADAGADGLAEIAPNLFQNTALLGMRVPIQALAALALPGGAFEGGWSNVAAPGLVLP